MRLVYATIDEYFDLGLLTSLGIYKRFIIYHNEDDKNYLMNTWIKKFTLKSQENDKIEKYFGSKIAMYFAWLEFLMRSLYIPAFFSLVLGIL